MTWTFALSYDIWALPMYLILAYALVVFLHCKFGIKEVTNSDALCVKR